MQPSNPFRAIRRAGVPLCAIETADPAATVAGVLKALNGKEKETPVMLWDLVRGLVGVNDAGLIAANSIAPNGAIETGNPTECLSLLAKSSPKGSVVFFSNAHRFIGNEGVAQAMWNLRDLFKGAQCTLVMLAPVLVLPDELRHDVVVISEPLPDSETLNGIVDSIIKDAELPAEVLPVERRPKVTDTLRGLSAFAAEQVLAMSLSKSGIDEDMLWERKRRMIEQTPGLKITRPKTKFADLGGLSNGKQFGKRIMSGGPQPIGAVALIDEIEKSLAGTVGDTSGTSQDQLGVLLRYMEDNSLPGMILIGPPGSGKTAMSNAMAGEAGVPLVSMDLGAMKGSLVGQSEAQIRAAMETYLTICNGNGLIIATCNKIVSLPPELRRRFTLGTWYYDMPDADERAIIWAMWMKRYGIEEQELPETRGFTGAEIKACCDVSYRTGMTLKDAVEYIVPVIKAAPDQIEALRKGANGRFISASAPGTYQFIETPTMGRKMEV